MGGGLIVYLYSYNMDLRENLCIKVLDFLCVVLVSFPPAKFWGKKKREEGKKKKGGGEVSSSS